MRSGLTEIVFKAKKHHTCSWCSERIIEGSSYHRWPNFDENGVNTAKMHPECMDAMNAWRQENPGVREFSPGEFQRGKTE